MEPRAKDALRRLLGERVCFDEPLARHTSLRVGGPAEAMARPASRAQLLELLALCRAQALKVHVLGGGFNTLAPDAGLPGLVLRLLDLRAIGQEPGGVLLAEAGATHTRVARFCADHGLSGLEFAAGIPGTVGGWLAMNAGIGVREMKDVVTGVEFVDLETGRAGRAGADRLRFAYRRLEAPAGALLLAARFRTTPADPEEIGKRVSALLARRRATQPLDQPSCGSVFRNPPGDHAGRLIEAAGLEGAREGGAEISRLHANFILNHGGATTADVLRLIERARSEVARRFGIELEPEVRLLGGQP